MEKNDALKDLLSTANIIRNAITHTSNTVDKKLPQIETDLTHVCQWLKTISRQLTQITIILIILIGAIFYETYHR